MTILGRGTKPPGSWGRAGFAVRWDPVRNFSWGCPFTGGPFVDEV
jgi:hypothetical protein